MNNGEKLIKKPIYKGGKKAMSEFIHAELKYPAKALAEKIEGVVAVRIDIDENGKVKKGAFKKKLGHGCDEEALRVCSMLEFIVDRKRKKRMTFHKTINVHFRLPKPKRVVIPTPAPTPPKKAAVSIKQGDTGSMTSTMGGSYTVTYTFVTKKNS